FGQQRVTFRRAGKPHLKAIRTGIESRNGKSETVSVVCRPRHSEFKGEGKEWRLACSVNDVCIQVPAKTLLPLVCRPQGLVCCREHCIEMDTLFETAAQGQITCKQTNGL